MTLPEKLRLFCTVVVFLTALAFFDAVDPKMVLAGIFGSMIGILLLIVTGRFPRN
jgi:hypothetical protein